MSEDIVIRLSVQDIQDLLSRAESGNYMIVPTEDFKWVRIEPYMNGESVG